MSILEAVDTAESRALAKTIGQTVEHFQAPTWNALGANDRTALLMADAAISKLEAAKVPKSLRGHVDNLKQALLDAGTYLLNPHHPICLVGHIGVGKSTAGNAIFGLSEGFGKQRRRSKESDADKGLLPTGGGGTTAFEFRVAYAHEPSIRIEPQREDKILADVRELCEFWIAEARGEKRERAIPTEMEKVYRNMAGLTRPPRDSDPVRRLIRPDTDTESLLLDIAAQMNLSGRTRTELLYREDREPNQSEAEWLQKRCDALNLGKLSDCPFARRLDIGLPSPALNAEGFRFTLLDLRGINTTDPRPDLHPDLIAAYSDPRALLVLCSNFLDAPDNCALSVIEHLKKRSASNESPMDQNRVTLLVLPHNDQATSVRRDDGSPVDDRDEGYDLKGQQIASRISDTIDKLGLRFFDSRRDEPEPIRSHILSRVDAIRDSKRKEIARLDETIDNLIDDIGQAHFDQTQKKVREKIATLLKQQAEQMDVPQAPTWLKLVRAVDQFHASSVWSIARGNGEGRSIDLYQVFAEFFREDAKERTTRATTELKTLLKELLHDDDMRRPEMRRSKSFVSEVIAMVDRQHEAFLQAAGPLALSSLKQVFKQDDEFWTPCAARWGQGSGFRSDVANRIEGWFKSHGRVSARLEERLQGVWDEDFVEWLRSYTVKA